MIDVILNEEGGLVLVHDEKNLDDSHSVEISCSNGEICLVGENDIKKPLGNLKPSMMEVLFSGMDGCIIRVDGWALSKVKKVNVLFVA
jgi:hypothetical protein